MIISVLFWALFLLILTNYVLFPGAAILLARYRGRPIAKATNTPSMSLIISAFNEEKIIADKLENALSLKAPGSLEIIVVSDGSTDSTPRIVDGFQSRGVVGLFDSARKGKASAMNRGVVASHGEILVFSDANTLYEEDALIKLAENFADTSVGAVSGRKCILKEENRASSLGDRLFWRFESRLKQAESLLGSVPTADGEIMAVRTSLYRSLPGGTINDDTAITLDIVRAGKRVVYEPAAVSHESASLSLSDDMAVKARMVYGGYQTLSWNMRRLLPPRDFFAFQYFCHKTLRHLMPFLLIGFFMASAILMTGFYAAVFWLQILFYVLALAGAVLMSLGKKVKVLYLPLYYCAMNFAALEGFIYFLRGRPIQHIWKKARR